MAGFGVPASPPPPDLSNLTEEEKQIIQSVLQRQKQMEHETLQLQRWAYYCVCAHNAILALDRIDPSLRALFIAVLNSRRFRRIMLGDDIASNLFLYELFLRLTEN